MVTTYLGALEHKDLRVAGWSEPLFEAFLAGAQLLYWTADTLYWVAKPAVYVERPDPHSRRLHREDGPALVGDLEDLWFWHGVLVPAYVVKNPQTITVEDIRDEENAEVRRVMMERMGWERFCAEADMQLLHRDELVTRFPDLPVSDLVDDGKRLVTRYRAGKETAELLEARGMTDFEQRPLRFVRLTDPSTGRQYVLRVRHDHRRAYEAVGWTFQMTEEQYKTSVRQHS